MNEKEVENLNGDNHAVQNVNLVVDEKMGNIE